MLELATLISRQARYRPDATAVVFEGQRLTYRAVLGARRARGQHAARARHRPRATRSPRVAGNSLELLETYWAVPTIGAVLVPLSPLLLREGLASLLRGSDARCLIAQSSMLPVLARDGGRAARSRACSSTAPRPGSATTARSARRPARRPRARRRWAQDDLFNIMFTSGTTGRAQGHHAHALRALDVRHAHGPGLPHDARVADAAQRRDRVQRRVRHDDAVVLPRRDLRAAARSSTPRRPSRRSSASA